MTFRDQGDPKGLIWIHESQKIQNRQNSLRKGVSFHFGQSWPLVQCGIAEAAAAAAAAAAVKKF